jgi:hypothetical protein
VFENDEHFEKKKGPQPFGPGRAGQFRMVRTTIYRQTTWGAHTERQMRNFPKLAEKKTLADFQKTITFLF